MAVVIGKNDSGISKICRVFVVILGTAVLCFGMHFKATLLYNDLWQIFCF